MRKIMLFGAAFALATGTFWAIIFTSPPISEARAVPRIDTRELTLKAHPGPAPDYEAL